jgi:hypothetical protein
MGYLFGGRLDDVEPWDKLIAACALRDCRAVRMRADGIDVWWRVRILLLSSDLDRRYRICRVSRLDGVNGDRHSIRRKAIVTSARMSSAAAIARSGRPLHCFRTGCTGQERLARWPNEAGQSSNRSMKIATGERGARPFGAISRPLSPPRQKIAICEAQRAQPAN